MALLYTSEAMDRLAGRGRLRVAVVGVTGAVGRKLLEVLEERSFPVADLVPLASDRPGLRTVHWAGREIEVLAAEPSRFEGVDIAFFGAGGDVSRALVPEAARAGALVIDKSSAFRLDPRVPLVVPEVNPADMDEVPLSVIASPNCSTTQLVVAVAPLHARAGLRRLVADTYQSVSGAGLAGIEDLEQGTRAILAGREPPPPTTVTRPIAFNCVPQIGEFDEDGFTDEETKLIRETRRILHLPLLAITCTAVRVPVHHAHSEALTMEFEDPLSPDEARAILSASPGVVVLDDPSRGLFPTPIDAAGRDEVFVGRIRRDPASRNGLHLWCVSDNLRKGAATNAVQIAEHAARG